MNILLPATYLNRPLLNAAGSVNSPNTEAILREVDDLAATGIGAITVGSFTIPPQAGNEALHGAPVYYHDVRTGKTYNSMGLPNIGVIAAAALAPEVAMRAHGRGKIIIYSGSPTHAPKHGSPVDQAVRLVYELLDTKVDLVELDVSCPNIQTEKGRGEPIMGYDLSTLTELDERLYQEIGETGRLGIKLPPYLSDNQKLLVPQLAAVLCRRNVFRFSRNFKHRARPGGPQ